MLYFKINELNKIEIFYAKVQKEQNATNPANIVIDVAQKAILKAKGIVDRKIKKISNNAKISDEDRVVITEYIKQITLKCKEVGNSIQKFIKNQDLESIANVKNKTDELDKLIKPNTVRFVKEKECNPVKFNERESKIGQYLFAANTPNRLGCGQEEYPKYEGDGKYCCSKTKATDQETLDYVNNSIVDMISYSDPDISKNARTKFDLNMKYLKLKRNQLLTSAQESGPLIDHLAIDYANELQETEINNMSSRNLRVGGKRKSTKRPKLRKRRKTRRSNIR